MEKKTAKVRFTILVEFEEDQKILNDFIEVVSQTIHDIVDQEFTSTGSRIITTTATKFNR